MHRTIWLTVALLAIGCSSLDNRGKRHGVMPFAMCPNKKDTFAIYGGVRTDWRAALKGDKDIPRLFALIDLPFSAILDTLLLPFDLSRLRYEQREGSALNPSQPCPDAGARSR
jgi:uncharacterized protein YceK